MATAWDNEGTWLYAERVFESRDRKLVPLVADVRHSRVLDFGCGTGLLTEKLAPLRGSIVAIDNAAEMIEVRRRKVAERRLDHVTPLLTIFDAAAIVAIPGLGDEFDLIVASPVCGL